ncbi:MAG: restriction endonuclease [Lachnospiraceae bacterium]|nr:restriction endonuclease [Lachnospiraceae bacterium]MBS4995521.1 restriction endonuclease [Roseburia sp.]
MMSVILADMEQDKWVWIIGILAVLVLAAAAGVVLCRRFRKRYADDELDEMEGLDFEYYCAELLRNRGFIEVEVTKSSGDYGIDILAEKEGVTYAIQCKRYNGPVGVKAVQEAYAGRDFYDRMVGCVLTNQYFTQPAVDAAQKLKILLWDRDYLEEMIEEGC